MILSIDVGEVDGWDVQVTEEWRQMEKELTDGEMTGRAEKDFVACTGREGGGRMWKWSNS